MGLQQLITIQLIIMLYMGLSSNYCNPICFAIVRPIIEVQNHNAHPLVENCFKTTVYIYIYIYICIDYDNP